MFSTRKIIPYLIVIVPLLLVLTLSFFMSTFYINKVRGYFEQAKVNSLGDYIDLQKSQSQQTTKQLTLLFEYTKNRVEPLIKKELQAKVELAYKTATNIHDKYKKAQRKKVTQGQIKDALYAMVFNDSNNFIFMTDYNANAVINGSHLEMKNITEYLDADYRSIVLEEIQKVRRRGAGFLESRRAKNGEKEIIYVKDLGFYKWYVGSSIIVKSKEDKLKSDLLEMIKSMPIESSDFIALFDAKQKLYGSNDFTLSQREADGWYEDKKSNLYYYVKYYKDFDWYVVHGFNTSEMSTKAKEKFKNLEIMLDKELSFIVKASAFIVLITVVLSLLLSLKINRIFKTYQEDVKRHQDELEELNSSLEVRVEEEVKAHREKDKLLTQSAKMAEMGDMLSMIAHQWRQPLNQLSYVVMNIESAFEYEELTQEYLESKVKEANELLEFMSVTIDEFRNYFRPDKERESVLVQELVNSTLFLVEKLLEKEAIKLEITIEDAVEISVYKNEFIQVLLNLLKNARDAFGETQQENKKIAIVAQRVEHSVLISVSDNAGGIASDVIEKVFDPYFSTKDKKNGTGLGLYMSKMILEQGMGAKLSVQNIEKGAEFTIEIEEEN